MTRWGITADQATRFQRIDVDLVSRINTDEFVGAKAQESGGGLALKLKDHQHSPLSKHIDLSASILGITGADGEERLDGIVRDNANLGIDTTSLKLHSHVSSTVHRKNKLPGMPRVKNEHRQDRRALGTSPLRDLFEYQPACLLEIAPC